MGVRRVMVDTFAQNIASIMVFENNGFHRTRIVENYQVVRGEMRDLQLLEREF